MVLNKRNFFGINGFYITLQKAKSILREVIVMPLVQRISEDLDYKTIGSTLRSIL